MKESKNSKMIGAVMMVVGTMIGGGMLALPMLSYSAGFIWSSLLMIVTCVLMLLTSFLVLEVNLGLPASNSSFSSMASRTLGKTGQSIVWFVYLFLLYSCLVAYIVGEADIIVNYLQSTFNISLNHWQSAVLFTTFLGAIVGWSTRAVDYLNRGLVTVKGGLLVASLILIAPKIDCQKLLAMPLGFGHLKYLWIAVPTFVCSFNFHFVIPSIRAYYGDNVQDLKRIFIYGFIVALIIYLWWSAAVLGVIPVYGSQGFTSMSEGAVGSLTQALVRVAHSRSFQMVINGFTNITLTTAFLGTALGLFDFLADGFKRPNTPFGRVQTACLTFIPPLVVALMFPNAFITALNYGAICIAILSIMIPALMVYRSRRDSTFQTMYRVKVGDKGLLLLLGFGALCVVLGMLYIARLLPILH